MAVQTGRSAILNRWVGLEGAEEDSDFGCEVHDDVRQNQEASVLRVA